MMDPNTSNAIIAIGTVWGVLITIVLFYVGLKAAKIDRLEEKFQQKAEEVVEGKLATLTAEMQVPFAELSAVIKTMEKRLERGDSQFDEQGEHAHKIELQLSDAKGQIQNWAMSTFATHSSLAELAKSVNKVQLALADCQARLQHHGKGHS